MKRTISCVVALGAMVGAATLAMPATASAAPVSETNCAKIATPTNPNGWGNSVSDEQGQAGKITATNVKDADGSLEFATSASMPRQASYHSAGSLPLSALKGANLTFEKSAGAAAWQIRVTGADTGTASGFATLVWDAPVGATLADASTSSRWWATRDLGAIKKYQNGTLEQLIDAANSDGKTATVDLYGISSQPGGTADAKVNVDNVTFHGCTTNFAVKGGDSGLGSVEFPTFGSS